MESIILIRQLSLGYGNNVVLDGITFDVPARGVTGVMGPSGAGKTSLLRALSGWSESTPSFWSRGEIHFAGRTIRRRHSDGEQGPSAAVSLLSQKDRLYSGSVRDNLIADNPASMAGNKSGVDEELCRHLLEAVGLREEFEPILQTPALALPLAAHKKLIAARLLSTKPDCLLVDEPFSDVALADEQGLIRFLRDLGSNRSVVVVLHNKLQARALCDRICLITGGMLVENTPAAEFFRKPRTDLGRQFLESGSCWPAALAAPAGMRTQQPKAPDAESWRNAPVLREFYWIIDGLLGGSQRPGLLGNEDADLRALSLLGVETLVSLTEEAFDNDRLAEYGVNGVHFPIPDMGIPDDPALALAICRRVSNWIDARQPTVLHCRAGLGRTGTMLACVLVSRGADAGAAIRTVRRMNPRYIQTQGQFDFVSRFREHLAAQSTSPASA